MVTYTNSFKEAKKIAARMQKEEPSYAEDVKIEITMDLDKYGIYDEPYQYVVHNETE